MTQFFRNPDAFADDYSVERWKLGRTLLVDLRSKSPELELLKPLCFHHRQMDDGAARPFGALLDRFTGCEGVAGMVAARFRSMMGVHDRRRWMDLAAALSKAGHYLQAMRALENCMVVQFLHPHYGYS